MNELKVMLDKVEKNTTKRARLYFVTRTIKKDRSKSLKAIEKYEYKTWSIETDEEIQKELFLIFKNKLDNISNKDKYIVTDYSLIMDDAEKKILTYSKKEKLHSFIHIVDEDLKKSSTLDAVENLEKIADNVWAYIIEIYDNGTILCALRKMAPSKVMVGKKGLLTKFRPNEKSLKLSKEQNVIFDKNIDVLYFNNIFYIVSKDNFEEIVGLHEEYREEANFVAEKIMKNPLINANYDIKSAIEDKNRFIRKLAKITKEIDKLNKTRIQKMMDVAKKFNQNFIIDTNGKIKIENENDLDIMIKLLDDYFLESHQTGKKYGASVKKEM